MKVKCLVYLHEIRKNGNKILGSLDHNKALSLLSSAVLVWRLKMTKAIMKDRLWRLLYMNILSNIVALICLHLYIFHVLMLENQIGPTIFLWRLVDFFIAAKPCFCFFFNSLSLWTNHIWLIFSFLFLYFWWSSYVHLCPSNGIQRHSLQCKEHL